MLDLAAASDSPNIKPAQKPILPDTQASTPEQKFDIYSAYVNQHGTQPAKDDLAAGRQVIVGLRIETDVRANQGKGVYDDRIALIWKELEKVKNGQKIPEVKHGLDFRANTDPSAQYEDNRREVTRTIFQNGKYVKKKFLVATDIYDPDGNKVRFRRVIGNDVDGSGIQAVGRLRAGSYKFYWGKNYLGEYALRPRDLLQPAERDVNHDGKFNMSDSWDDGKACWFIDTGIYAFLIHVGGEVNTGSAGCQTLPPVEHAKFFQALQKQENYYYVLVNLK